MGLGMGLSSLWSKCAMNRQAWTAWLADNEIFEPRLHVRQTYTTPLCNENFYSHYLIYSKHPRAVRKITFCSLCDLDA